MMIEFTPCACNVCAWLDTPKEKRRTTERQMLQGVRFRPQREQLETEIAQRKAAWQERWERRQAKRGVV